MVSKAFKGQGGNRKYEGNKREEVIRWEEPGGREPEAYVQRLGLNFSGPYPQAPFQRSWAWWPGSSVCSQRRAPVSFQESDLVLFRLGMLQQWG